jgi:hypothetical protein
MGLDPVSWAALAGLALSVGTTVHSLAKGGPDLPDVPKPVKPPAPPALAPPAPLPPPPSETEAGEAVASERRKRQARFGVSQTILTSPLGSGGSTQTGSKTLLGG